MAVSDECTLTGVRRFTVEVAMIRVKLALANVAGA